MIGRDTSCALRIPDGRISRRHLQIAYDGRRERHFALDIGSANGVTVNGLRLTRGAERLLHDGDEICIGRTRLRYALSGTDLAAGAADRPGDVSSDKTGTVPRHATWTDDRPSGG